MKAIVRSVAEAADTESPREQRARASAELIRSARAYRWVGIYDVGDDEITLVGDTGAEPPARQRLAVSEGLGGEAVSTRATVVGREGSEIIVPVLGAESGIVIGMLNVQSDGTHAISDEDVRFLEECAAVLRPLYD